MMTKNSVGFFIAFALFVLPTFVNAQGVAVPTLTITTSKASMVASPNPVYANLPTILWSSTNTTLCTASGSGWSGKTALNGSQKVNPPVTTTYTMTCAGNGGAVTKSVTVIVTNSQVANVLGGFDQATSNSVAQTGQKQTGFAYVWNRSLQIGSPYPADVSALQTALTLEGVYTGEITGGFYNQTFSAVKLFQKKYGIESIGFVGPQTRAKLNELYGA